MVENCTFTDSGSPGLACPSLHSLPFICSRGRREPCGWGSMHHLQALSGEIAAIHHDQRSPSNSTGRAINCRDTVALGHRERGGGVPGLMGVWVLTYTSPIPPSHPGVNQPEPQGHPAEALPPPLANVVTCPWIPTSELSGLSFCPSGSFLKLLSCLAFRCGWVSLGKANLLF